MVVAEPSQRRPAVHSDAVADPSASHSLLILLLVEAVSSAAAVKRLEVGLVPKPKVTVGLAAADRATKTAGWRLGVVVTKRLRSSVAERVVLEESKPRVVDWRKLMLRCLASMRGSVG